ncbi:MAG: hypothetical protein HY654_02130, partial [Acidobacteria bacterium]|nr:hypothetical protein [Acidobacteriota bacterium]
MFSNAFIFSARSALSAVAFLFLVDLAGAQGIADFAAIRYAIVAAEDARADGAALKPILDGLKHADPAIQRLAVRALGRLERSEHA